MDREKTDGGIYVMVRYDRLWKLLIDKKMNRTELKEAAGISFNVLARLGKNEPVSFESIEKIMQRAVAVRSITLSPRL